MDGSGNWEKCKLMLVRAAGGHMLQFYYPPKVPTVGPVSCGSEYGR